MNQRSSLQRQYTGRRTFGNTFHGLSWLIVICVFASSCVRPAEPPVAEAPPAPVQAEPVETPKPEDLAGIPPPKIDEVEDTVERVFKGAALIAAGDQSFVVGDFNGDVSLDLAVVIKPAFGKLNEMNPEYPSWLLIDPFVVRKPGMPPPRVTTQETLLAIIHGYGPDGWRDSQATQTFLLKNAAGSGMRTQPAKQFYAVNRGRKLPRVEGDLIGETLQNKPGYLYYTGAAYSWYDPKTFKAEPEKRLVHGSGAVAEK
ncbi:MAG TPA: hypothetical protein VG778_05595 [Blastocatellia bacterium]|nr:hypothetical protein [Blastocatellia bacterium]